jgi:hypothetical protein
MNIADLKANPGNPRQITDEKHAMLKKSLKKFGDLSGIVFNRRSGLLVGGHQRVKGLPPGAAVTRDRMYKRPTRTGTVAEGFVLFDGERYTYREVDWDQKTERAANIAANQHGGEWDNGKLGEWLRDLQKVGLDPDEIGMTSQELADFLKPIGADGAVSGPPKASMNDKFLVPPFSVLDARQGYWQERKRQWLALGIKSELGRGGGASPGGSPRPATRLGKNGRTVRGDGAGRGLRQLQEPGKAKRI